MAIPGIFQVIVFFILGGYQRWQYSLPYLVVHELVLVFSFVILIMSSLVSWWILSFALLGISSGFIYSSSLFYSSQAKTDKTEKTGFHEAILMSGALVGTFSGGIVFRVMSMAGAYSMCIILIIACIIAQFFVRSKVKAGRG